MEKQNKRRLGADYEQVAAEYLKHQGYEILEQNYYTRYGEIDIIARKGDTIAYVEIKYRSTDRFGDPLEAVGPKKQQRISRAAASHYSRYGARQGLSCRFDVIGIYGDGHLKHMENAFPYQGRQLGL